MGHSDCDRRWEIDALREGALGEKDAEAFERHLRVCDVCAKTVAQDTKLRQLAVATDREAPNELELRRLRARVLRDVATGAPRGGSRLVPLAASFALVAVVTGALAYRGTTRAPADSRSTASVATPVATEPRATGAELAGSVVASEGAHWSQSREGLTEEVRLEAGSLRIQVRHQSPAERFLVELPDGELEVRGTTFEATTRAGMTERVYVEEGIVAVRIRGAGGETVLHTGETWRPLPAEAAPRTAVRPGRKSAPATTSGLDAPARRRSVVPVAGSGVASEPDDQSGDYAIAVKDLQNGKYAVAASEFRALIVAHPKAPQAEDASFLEAAALARGGRTDAAALAAEEHLARFPGSFHRKEAAILVARAARDRGDCPQARAVLSPWLAAPADPEAVGTLKTCAER